MIPAPHGNDIWVMGQVRGMLARMFVEEGW